MSKKAAKKTTKTAPKAAPKKAPAKKAEPKKNESMMTKHYLHNETEEFYASHPNVKPLLILFMLVSVAVFFYLIRSRTGTM